MTEHAEYDIRGQSAATVIRSIERGIGGGKLEPGQPLPSVRALAEKLGISPSTVAAAYRDLRQRGVLISYDRSRTLVAHRPSVVVRLADDLPEGTIDLASGNPDPMLLPDLKDHLSALTPVDHVYGADPADASLINLACRDLSSDAIPHDHISIVGGALDGIERVLEVHCRLGDRIAVEDPGYIGSLDLIRTLGLVPVPIAIDDDGPLTSDLEMTLSEGISALLLVPRAQNPTGAALTAERASALQALLDDYPEVLVIEDDHASIISPVQHQTVMGSRPHWAVIRSLSKSLGPDLRVAYIASDEDTAIRVTGRQRLGTGWVSHLLQSLAARAWQHSVHSGTIQRAISTYEQRRQALLKALSEHEITAFGASGINVWIPVTEEVPVVQGLMARGWSVQAGEPFRLQTEPAIRITTSALDLDHVDPLVDDLEEVLGHRLGSRRG